MKSSAQTGVSCSTITHTGIGTHTAVSAEASASSLGTHTKSHSRHLIHTKQQHTNINRKKMPMSTRGIDEAFNCGGAESVSGRGDGVLLILEVEVLYKPFVF